MQVLYVIKKGGGHLVFLETSSLKPYNTKMFSRDPVVQ